MWAALEKLEEVRACHAWVRCHRRHPRAVAWAWAWRVMACDGSVMTGCGAGRTLHYIFNTASSLREYEIISSFHYCHCLQVLPIPVFSTYRNQESSVSGTNVYYCIHLLTWRRRSCFWTTSSWDFSLLHYLLPDGYLLDSTVNFLHCNESDRSTTWKACHGPKHQRRLCPRH